MSHIKHQSKKKSKLPVLLDKPAMLHYVGLSPQAVYVKIKSGVFPPPLVGNNSKNFWFKSEIDKFLELRKENQTHPSKLVKVNGVIVGEVKS